MVRRTSAYGSQSNVVGDNAPETSMSSFGSRLEKQSLRVSTLNDIPLAKNSDKDFILSRICKATTDGKGVAIIGSQKNGEYIGMCHLQTPAVAVVVCQGEGDNRGAIIPFDYSNSREGDVEGTIKNIQEALEKLDECNLSKKTEVFLIATDRKASEKQICNIEKYLKKKFLLNSEEINNSIYTESLQPGDAVGLSLHLETGKLHVYNHSEEWSEFPDKEESSIIYSDNSTPIFNADQAVKKDRKIYASKPKSLFLEEEESVHHSTLIRSPSLPMLVTSQLNKPRSKEPLRKSTKSTTNINDVDEFFEQQLLKFERGLSDGKNFRSKRKLLLSNRSLASGSNISLASSRASISTIGSKPAINDKEVVESQSLKNQLQILPTDVRNEILQKIKITVNNIGDARKDKEKISRTIQMSSYLEEEHPDAQITQDIAAWMKESKLGVDDVRVVLCKPSVIKLPRSDGKDNCLVLAMPKEKKHANIPPLVLPIMNTHYAQWKFNVKSSDILDGQLKACDSKAAGIIKDINNRIIMGEDVARKTLSSPNFGSKETTIRELIYCVKNKKNLEELRSLTGAELRKHEAALKEMTLTIYETEALVESGQTAAKGVGAWRYLYTIVNDTLIGLGIFDSHTNPLKAWKP